VLRDGVKVGEVRENQYIGEMSFLGWENSMKTAKKQRSVFSSLVDGNNESTNGSNSSCTSTSSSGGAVVAFNAPTLIGNSDVICLEVDDE
jgi:hypothetical protein